MFTTIGGTMDAIRIALAGAHERTMGAVIQWAGRRLTRRGYDAEGYLVR